jgi:hypothetical protein
VTHKIPCSVPVVICGGVLLTAAIIYSNVSTKLTAADRKYADLIMRESGYGGKYGENSQIENFEDQIRAIAAVQDAVLKTAPTDEGIPLGKQRELADLHQYRHGLCYDRSRAIEKILSWLGFQTRHVSVYSTAKISPLVALFVPQNPSHAVTEVLTQKGWMLVDSNARWMGLDVQRNPISLSRVRETTAWAPESSDRINSIFKEPFIAIRGLYSRHGRFYPPFVPIPDFNAGQLLSNITE